MADDAPVMAFDVGDENQARDPRLMTGSIVVNINDDGKRDKQKPDDEQFHANLADNMSADERARLASDLLDEIDAAGKSAAPWFDVLEKGIKAMGIDRRQETRNTPVPGSSAVVHPMLAQSAVDFQSRAYAELCPPAGPVSTTIIGDQDADEELEAKSQRVKDFQNWQVLSNIDEWCEETDKLLMMLPLEGSSWKKVWWDQSYGRVRAAYIPTEQVIMPYHGGSEKTTPLLAEVIPCLKHQIEANIESGLWLEHDIVADQAGEDRGENVRQARDHVLGEETEDESEHEEHRPYTYYECQVRRHLPDLDAEGREWLITVSSGARTVVSIRRNWKPDDPSRERRMRLFQYKMFPWSGSRGVGLYHLIGGLTSAATGALRALLDGAHRQTAPGGWKAKTSAKQSGTVTRGYGEYAEVDLPPGMTRIQDVLMEDTYPGPAPVLFELLGFLVDQGSKFASVALQEMADSTSTTPVGTTLARVQEGSRVFSAIYRRLHRIQAQEFREIHDINRETITQAWIEQQFGSPDIFEDDFDRKIDVLPISDPNSFSQLQRTLQSQQIFEFAAKLQELGVPVDMREVAKQIWVSADLPAQDKIIPDPPDPVNVSDDPYGENVVAMQGTPLKIDADDEHISHIAGHMAILSIPGVSEGQAGQMLIGHIISHAGAAAGMSEDPPGTYTQLMQQLAKVVEPADQDGMRKLAEAEMAKVQAKVMELDARRELDQARLQFDKEKIQAELASKIKLEREQMEANIQEAREKMQFDIEKMREEMKIDLQKMREENASDERIAAAKIASQSSGE